MKRFVLLLLAVCLQVAAIAQIEAWELSPQPGNQVSSNATSTAAGISAGVLGRGAGVTATGAGGSINSSGWFSSTSPTITTLADAIANNDYYEFTLPVQSGYLASVTGVGVIVRSSNTGPNTATLRSSVDGFSANLGTIPITTASVLNNIAVSLTNLSGTITFRLYGYGGAANPGSNPASGGTFRIGTSVVATDNDLIVSGSVVQCPSVGATISDPTCAGNDGQINLTVTGGTPPITFNWTASNGGSGIVQGQEDQTGLSAGTYDVTVSDASGCTFTATFTLNAAFNCGCPSLTTNVTNTTCGATNGSIEVVTTGGIPPFQYDIGNGPQNDPVFSGLPAGVYTITVTGSDCTGVTTTAAVQAGADDEAPTFNEPLPGDLVIGCNDPVPPADVLTATDNCDPAPVVNFNETMTSVTCAFEPVITRTWTASDANGNSTVHTQTITVVDDTPPLFNLPLPGDLTVSCDAPVPLADNVTASDNCDPGAVPAVIFINEIHYDNAGADANEFIELAGTAGLDLSQYQIVLYNGNGGVTYDVMTLSGLIDNEGNGFGARSFPYPVNGVQNGAPDGMALVKLPNTVIQFLSYEGAFLATNGPAAGMTSVDIGVLETGSEPPGLSLQLTGSGQQYGDFTWIGPVSASAGSLNAGQTISPLPGTIAATLMETMMMGDCDGEMTIMRMYTATDACGNSTVHMQTIYVEDFTPPGFAPPLPQNITIECSAPVPPPANLIATDNCDDGTPAAAVWINEIHYDNVGTDVNEFVEIAGTAGTDLTEYSIFLYNGTGGGTYGSMTLTGTLDNESNGFGAASFSYPVNGLQNGAPDGLALVHGGMVVQFLSYEGSFTAVGGPANGMMSTDIGVLEDGTNAAGTSLRLTGNGNAYTDFSWNPPAAATPGSLNTGQTIVPLPTGLVVTFDATTTPGNCPPEYTITRTWSVADGCGNSTSLVQVITVDDSTPPVFTFVPASTIEQCSANIPALGTPTATDNCDAQVTIVYNGETNVPGNCLNSRVITRSWTASDDCGNATTAVQVISVNDNQPPTLVCQNATVNLTIFGTVSVNVSSLIQTLSDNCSPNAAITLSPAGPITFTCAEQGTTVPVTITATDQCGNVSTCTAQVTVNPFVRCTPKILITDPCVCKNNATTTENGQFGETIKIESLAGKTWTITAISGLFSANSPNPPAAPIPIAPGATFTENPLNSGDYFLSGVHVDALGYSITVTSEKGEVLTISNSCQYPNAQITSNLDGPFCLFSDPVPLTGIPGDANIVSEGFTINGNPATIFNPGDGVGQYLIEYTVDGGTPKAAGPDDPGCIQKVKKFVTVFETPAALTCNDLVQVSVDQNCQAEVNPDMILDGTYFCFDDYTVTITGLGGAPNYGNTVTSANIGQTLKVTVKHLVSGNTCWGHIYVEDKLPPVLDCSPVTISCGITNYQPDYLKNTLNINEAYPAVAENCGNYSLSFVDDFIDLPCGGTFNGVPDLSAYARRVWTAVDESGNSSACTQYIYFTRKHVADVLLPADVTVSCTAPVTDPAVTGTPYIEDHGLKINLYPGGTFCEMQTGYVDQLLPDCDGSYKILRTWTVLDWCLPTTPTPPFTNPLFHIQVIKVMDNKGPAITCPANLTVSTDPFTCCATAELPDVVVEDNCSRVNSAAARITVTNGNNTVIATYDVDGTLTTFPNNNLWDADTLANYGYTPCLPIGAHIVTYIVEDNCGNTGTCTFRLTVADNTPPVPACDDFTNVGLGVDGRAFIDAETFDDGSYDNCSQVYFKARRSNAGSFSDQVQFTCADIGKTIMVVLRVYDVTVNAGSVSLTTQETHANDCMVQVYIEDKIPPYCKAPKHVTVSCENFDPSFWAYGAPTTDDNCCVDTVFSTVNYNQFDTVCNKGTITRTFRVVDCGGTSNQNQCTQRIIVSYEQDYFVRFPNDVIVTVCDGTGNFGEPVFFGEDCELLGVSYEDEVFTVVPDACFKIERTWTIINWCTYDPNKGCVEVPNPNPNAITNHPTNLTGPTVSALGTPAPWTPSNVAVSPGEANTNYSVFYHGGTYKGTTIPNIAGTNCYRYKQIVKVIDTQDPLVENCPGPDDVEVCDVTPNDPLLWNEMYWYDANINSHNLCEGPTDLTITATDLCSNANISFRYLLFLDLDGDGTMETVINSVNTGIAGLGWNAVPFGNAGNPNYTGGTIRQFDGRPVPANQKYGFTIQTTVSGTKKTASVRWNTQQQQSNFVVPELPYGTHKIKWFIEDGCGNETFCEYIFVVKDCKAPTVVCVNGLSINLMPTGMITLWASDFLKYTEDNCTPSGQLKIGIRKSGTGNGFPLNPDGTPQTAVTFTCDELGTQLVELWSQDKAGNADYCETYVVVQDQNGVCNDNQIVVNGVLKTEQQNGLQDATVQLTGTINQITMSDDKGQYMFNAVPAGGSYTITPTKDNDPLNGVSTFDLVLINKHILGLEPLNSPYKMIAADANNSRSITTFDIVELRKLILGIYTELPNNSSWRFVEQSYQFPNPANPFQVVFPETISATGPSGGLPESDFVAVKVGDVNGNAITSSLTSADDRTSGTLLFDVTPTVSRRDIKAGETFTLHFKAAEKVAGYQFTLYFPNLEVLNVTPGTDMSLGNFGIFNTEHALTTSFDRTETSGEFSVTFRALASGTLEQMLAVSSRITRAEAYPMTNDPMTNDPMTNDAMTNDAMTNDAMTNDAMTNDPMTNDAMTNDAMTNDAMTKMTIALRFNGANGPVIAGQGFELYQNQPNPWVSKTQIGFYLPEATEATLTVFDETGRLLFTQQGAFAKGHNAVTLDRALVNTTGVLYYKVETATDSAVRKMIQSK